MIASIFSSKRLPWRDNLPPYPYRLLSTILLLFVDYITKTVDSKVLNKLSLKGCLLSDQRPRCCLSHTSAIQEYSPRLRKHHQWNLPKILPAFLYQLPSQTLGHTDFSVFIQVLSSYVGSSLCHLLIDVTFRDCQCEICHSLSFIEFIT